MNISPQKHTMMRLMKLRKLETVYVKKEDGNSEDSEAEKETGIVKRKTLPGKTG
jgi:hypothetical protein